MYQQNNRILSVKKKQIKKTSNKTKTKQKHLKK